MVKGIIDKRASINDQVNFIVGGNYLEPLKYVQMVMEYAKAFGQDPDRVFSSTNCETVFAFYIDLYRRGYVQDVWNEVDRLNNIQPTGQNA